MFQNLTVFGSAAAILWGYRTAAALRTWTISRHKDPRKKTVWVLVAQPERVDSFMCGQTPLQFAAPRATGGFWYWPVETVRLSPDRLIATLGPPEQ